MDANRKYPEARSLTYGEFPSMFVWNKGKREWTKRKKGFAIGRLQFIHPGSGQLYYLRTLLNHIRGAKSFKDIRTLNNVVYDTFKDACYALGLLRDEKEFIDVIIEASHRGTTYYLKKLFVTLLVLDQLNQPELIWSKTWQYLSDDILYRQRLELRIEDLVLTDEELQNFALAAIEKLLQSNNTTLKDFPSMPQPDMSLLSNCQNRLIQDELNYNRQALAIEHEKLVPSMTSGQRGIYNKIMQYVSQDKAIRSRGEIVLSVASSGIAAVLIPGGRTTHSRFAIPLNIDEFCTCNIASKSPLAQLIIKARLIIWDEALMMHKYCFQVVDKTFRDILKSFNPNSKNNPFGGKVVVLGSDFRQILPAILKGTREDIVHVIINSSYIWDFCQVMILTKNMRLQIGSSRSDVKQMKQFSDWLLSIGEGKIGEDNDGDLNIEIPDDMIIKNSGDPIASIVADTYPSFSENFHDPSYFQDRAILTPKNEVVELINDYMLSLILGEAKKYLSFDTPCEQSETLDGPYNILTPKLLNTIKAPGLSNHELKLKAGVPVMLVRNID